MADKDKYGIPSGGNPGPGYTIRHYAGITHQLSWPEMIAVVALGGWPQSLWAEAAATSAAESSRIETIYNTYKRGHFGLFQISRSDHPDFFAPDGIGMKWVNGEDNAAEGYKIYKAQGWGAWSAHSNGSYLAYLAQAKAAVAKVKAKGTSEAQLRSWFTDATVKVAYDVAKYDPDSGNPEGPLDRVTGAAKDVAGAVSDATGLGAISDAVTGLYGSITNPSFWMRVGYGVLGVVLVAGGLFLVVRNSPTVQKTADAVTSVVPGGAAVKAVKGAV